LAWRVRHKYIEFIEKLEADQAGKLGAGEGETTETVRQRLGDASILIGNLGREF
jgi:L-aminopeptidase/D-esterase-like protein